MAPLKLDQRSIKSIVRSLGKLSSRWLKKDYSYRKKAVQRLRTRSGLSEAMAEALLDLLFKELTEKKLWQLLKAELRDPLVLDGFRKDPLAQRHVRAQGPKQILHIFAGNVPNPAIVSFVCGMLVKSANVGKVSSKDPGFLDIYLDSLRSVDAGLARTNSLISSRSAAKELIKEADLVVAYGSDEALVEIRKELPQGKPFMGYGHRFSFALYTREVLNKRGTSSLAGKTARDIWMMDQRGCLSPLVLYAEKGGRVRPLFLAELVAEELKKLSAGWAVYYEEGAAKTRRQVVALPALSGHRVIRVKAFRNETEIYRALSPLRKYLQAAALEAGPSRRPGIADALACLGVNRICRAGRMQSPPLTWHHDGKFNLASWVTWTDLE